MGAQKSKKPVTKHPHLKVLAGGRPKTLTPIPVLAERQWGAEKARLVEVTPGTFEVHFPALIMPIASKGTYSMENARANGFTDAQVLLGAMRGLLRNIAGQLK